MNKNKNIFTIFLVCLIFNVGVPQLRVSGQNLVGNIQKMDTSFWGFWKLNLDKSSFQGNQKPKTGLVNWTNYGWAFAILTADDQLYADAVIIDEGCKLIGVPDDYSADIEVIAPKHLRITIRQGSVVRRVGDIELVDVNTTKTTHQVMPAGEKPYTETTIWERQ